MKMISGFLEGIQPRQAGGVPSMQMASPTAPKISMRQSSSVSIGRTNDWLEVDLRLSQGLPALHMGLQN
jgi:hypothetical protein